MKILKVHNAVGRTVEAVENWLQLRPFQLPRATMLNAYLHFEALSDHEYDFCCHLCGYFPPLLSLDVNKKGVFELAGMVLINYYTMSMLRLMSAYEQFIVIILFHFMTVSDHELPDFESELNPDVVDAEVFWEQVNLGIIYRGILRGYELVL